MNTLSKQITGTYFFNEDEDNYNKLRKIWHDLVNDKEKKHLLTHYEHIIYLVLLGKDWRKAISISTKPIRLENGYIPKYHQLFASREISQYRFDKYIKPLFGDLFTIEQIKNAENSMNIPKDWKDFGKVDAYKDAE